MDNPWLSVPAFDYTTHMEHESVRQGEMLRDHLAGCLERIEPYLVPGGIVIVDDYFRWPGCRTAVDEFIEGRAGRYKVTVNSRLHMMKIALPIS